MFNVVPYPGDSTAFRIPAPGALQISPVAAKKYHSSNSHSYHQSHLRNHAYHEQQDICQSASEMCELRSLCRLGNHTTVPHNIHISQSISKAVLIGRKLGS